MDEAAHREILISIGAVVTLILIILIVIMFVKCRKYSKQVGKPNCKGRGKGQIPNGNEKFPDSAFTSSALYGHPHRSGMSKQGTLQRDHHIMKNGGFEPRLSTSRGQSVESTYDQHNISGGLLPMPHHLTPQTHDRYAHLHLSNDGTLSRQPISGATTTSTMLSNGLGSAHEIENKSSQNGGVTFNANRRSESESWLESSRSRETSPASSIPPGMPAFRVIPLCNGTSDQAYQDEFLEGQLQNDSFSHAIGSTTFQPGAFGTMSNTQRVSSTLGSDVTSNPASERFANYTTNLFAPIGAHSAGTIRATPESASNADTPWQIQPSIGDTSMEGRTRGQSMGASSSALNLDTNNSTGSNVAPLLRRNQYWV